MAGRKTIAKTCPSGCEAASGVEGWKLRCGTSGRQRMPDLVAIGQAHSAERRGGLAAGNASSTSRRSYAGEAFAGKKTALFRGELCDANHPLVLESRRSMVMP
jgi:hypothetical protein